MATTGTSVAQVWGATPAEVAEGFPCDRHLPEAEEAWLRAVDVAAPPATVFRWLCQLRVAPYSYDWIDNLGRPSPPTLTPGLERLEIGQRFMVLFDLVDFEADRHVTIRTRGSWPGQVAVTYRVTPALVGTRLVAKICVRSPGGLGWLLRRVLVWGDLVMMRRQLLNLKALAERG